PLHLECKVEPVADNTLQVYWLRNGNPLPHAHRFRTFHDFGYVSLDILSVYAEDSGTFTCVAKNAVGEAQTSTQFISHRKCCVLKEPHHLWEVDSM
uniref:Ig-like domain-containing protein n=1 Tax=Acrobeloides nanus TaxID=290746 RepID=A0A914DC75_9BILA